MKALPVNPDQSPLVVLDLLFKLKIKDVMTAEVITVQRTDSLRKVQHLMRDSRISGVPVSENRRLFGIISIDDIIRALDAGHINDPVDRHMSVNVVVLEEDMPLSFGISYFDKFKFGRFPVLNHNNQLVGILSSRDVSTTLLLELLKEYRKIEEQLPHHAPQSAGPISQRFRINRYDFENAGKAAQAIKKILIKRNVPSARIRCAAVAAYEMEINQVVHSIGGNLSYVIDDDKIELFAIDDGPGIANVDQALEEGYTTANEWIKSLGFGAGMGLTNIRRVADEFSIRSTLGSGTRVHAVVRLKDSNGSATDKTR